MDCWRINVNNQFDDRPSHSLSSTPGGSRCNPKLHAGQLALLR